MNSNGDIDIEDAGVQDALQELANLEKDFAAVEIDAMRQKEYSLIELYERRSKFLSSIPGFWPSVLSNGPEELSAVLSPIDAQILDSIIDLKIERYQIKSGAEGEPRSLRFTFTFDSSKQKFFENTTVTKDFEFVGQENGPGGLVSQPVNFKWTKAGKKAKVNKLLDLAEQLYQAESALVSDRAKGAKKIAVEQEERAGLWQYEKLREELEKEGNEPEAEGRSFLEWFGYRGAVTLLSATDLKETNGNGENDEEDEDEEDDGTLEVEIFPAGEDVALALAEDLWPNIMDYFMQAHIEDDLEDLDEIDEDEEDGDAPELVQTAEFEGFDEDEKRPSKKQRIS